MSQAMKVMTCPAMLQSFGQCLPTCGTSNPPSVAAVFLLAAAGIGQAAAWKGGGDQGLPQRGGAPRNLIDMVYGQAHVSLAVVGHPTAAFGSWIHGLGPG